DRARAPTSPPPTRLKWRRATGRRCTRSNISRRRARAAPRCARAPAGARGWPPTRSSWLARASQGLCHVPVGLGAASAEELACSSHFFNDREIEMGDPQLVFALRRLRHEAAARIDEIGRAIEFADIPRRLATDAIDAAHEISVGHGVRRLLQLP